MRTSETIAKLSPDLVAALGKIEGAVKDKKNDHFKNRYATLEAVIEATRTILAENSLCVVQAPGEMAGNLLTMTTRLIHKSGEWIEAVYQIPLLKVDPQASGSAITYARRYALMALLNVPAVDDDGEAAQGRANGQQTNTPAPKKDYGPSSVGPDFEGAEGVRGKSSHQAKKDGTDLRFNALRNEVWGLESPAACTTWANARADEIKTMPEAWRKQLREDLEEQKRLILADAAEPELEPAE